MKIQKRELSQKMNKIKGVVPKRPVLPVLQGILVADGYLIASNTEITIKAKIEGFGGERFIIPERAFDLINNLPDGEIDISVSEKHIITIKADKIKNKYQTLDPEQFPEITLPKEGSELTIKADVLMKSMKRVSYAVPDKGINPTMSSMCLQASAGKLNFVGLDGHMLAWDKTDYDGEFELLIPKSTIDKLESIGLSGDVKIKHNKISAVFITEDFEIYTRLVNGKYFPYQSMFDRSPLHTIVSRTALLDAMARAKMCTEEKNPVKVEVEESILHLSIKDKTADYYETLELQECIPEVLAIGFNARLVLETLKSFDCENVRISFKNATMPMIIEDVGSNFKAIVLPVKIN